MNQPQLVVNPAVNRNFMARLNARWEEGKFVCVGLDPVWGKMPTHLTRSGKPTKEAVLDFCKGIVDKTKDIACAYKPNAAFFEAFGLDGMYILLNLIIYINQTAPGVPVIYDAKRGDIGGSNFGYAQSAFDILGADAITVSPYLGGGKALAPFLGRSDKGVIILCRTSNPESAAIQEMHVETVLHGCIPLYEAIAHEIVDWNTNGNCLVVVGATNKPEVLVKVRRIIGDIPILIPGLGTQEGDLEASLRAGQNSKGEGCIFNSSSALLYASSGTDFAEAARRETLKLDQAIRALRAAA